MYVCIFMLSFDLVNDWICISLYGSIILICIYICESIFIIWICISLYELIIYAYKCVYIDLYLHYVDPFY